PPTRRQKYEPESTDPGLIGEASSPVSVAKNLTCGPESKTSPAHESILGLGKHRNQSMNQSYPDSLQPQPNWNASTSTENIVNNIKTYLSYRRHETCDAVPSASGQTYKPTPRPSMLVPQSSDAIGIQPRWDNDTYLVSTDDIAEILDIVIDGLRITHDRHLSTGCLSVLFPSHSRARAGTHKKGIFPQCSKFAGQATTISSVKSAFSVAGYAQGARQHPHTTQQQSYHHLEAKHHRIIPEDGDAVSSLSNRCGTPQTTSPTPSVLMQRGNGVSGVGTQSFNPPRGENLWLERRPSSTPLPCKRPAVERANMPANEHDIVSFPPLRPRSCTNDWVAPQPGLENFHPEIQHTPTLYQCGVDAHRGNTPSPGTQRDASPSNTDLPSSTTSPRNSPIESPKIPAKKRMGSSMGIASHRRRSTLHQIDQPDQNPGTFLLDSLRRYSLMPLLEHTPEFLRRKTVVPKPFEDVPLTEHRRMSSRAMLEEILARAPPQGPGQSSRSRNSSSSSSNPSKTYRMASRRGSDGSYLRRLSCLEESSPHVCADEQPTPISERSFEDSLR
ncbi:hypothetical protein PG994_014739, partial [Apiospora phragmitis]